MECLEILGKEKKRYEKIVDLQSNGQFAVSCLCSLTQVDLNTWIRPKTSFKNNEKIKFPNLTSENSVSDSHLRRYHDPISDGARSKLFDLSGASTEISQFCKTIRQYHVLPSLVAPTNPSRLFARPGKIYGRTTKQNFLKRSPLSSLSPPPTSLHWKLHNKRKSTV